MSGDLYLPGSMKNTPTRALPKRVIGSYAGDPTSGPVIIAVCGIHGNEPAGLRAAAGVLADLNRRRPAARGEFHAIAGNRGALAENRRFVTRDLNRQWTRSRVAALDGADPDSLGTEEREQWELWAILREAFTRSRGPAILLDLHTSSADGAPFATLGDTLRNRRFVAGLPIPAILGLEEVIDGSLLEFVNDLGHVTMGVEGGRHDRPGSEEHHRAVLWLTLAAAGFLRREDVPDADGLEALLDRATEGIPRLIEVRHRHALHGGDGFGMMPGFHNFQPVRKGQQLGADLKGPVRARETGLLLLPLYQGQGEDGFFLGREVRPSWLTLSAALRRSGADGLTGLLPGVRRHPDHDRSLIIAARAARVYPLDLFHLLGYRKRRWRSGELVVTRRFEFP